MEDPTFFSPRPKCQGLKPQAEMGNPLKRVVLQRASARFACQTSNSFDGLRMEPLLYNPHSLWNEVQQTVMVNDRSCRSPYSPSEPPLPT